MVRERRPKQGSRPGTRGAAAGRRDRPGSAASPAASSPVEASPAATPQRRRRSDPATPEAKRPAADLEATATALKTLVAICEQAGWELQHLKAAPARQEKLVALCIRELVACREAGRLELTLALADAAEAQGLQHPRIQANRERARRAQLRERKQSAAAADAPAAPRSGKRGRGKEPGERSASLIARLRSPLALLPPATTATPPRSGKGLRSGSAETTTPPPPAASGSAGKRNRGQGKAASARKAPASAPSESAAGSPATPKPSLPATEQLQALQGVCRRAGWAAEHLGDEAASDVALACAREMQRCRQANQHALVVALAAEAALLGLEHERIRENLARSRGRARRESVLAQVSALMQGNRASQDAAIQLLLDAMTSDPDCPDYRQILEDTIARDDSRSNLKGLTPELRRATLDFEVNQMLLDLLERRRQSDHP